MRRVLEQAEQRKARREDTLRRLVQARPEAPQGLMATLQRKGHQQALLAWEGAKAATTKLVEQARRLTVRLLEATGNERLAAWASDHLQRGQPCRSSSKRAVSTAPAKPLPPPSRRDKLPDLSRFSMEDQYRLYQRIVDQLEVVGQEKANRVAANATERLQRRQTQASRSEANRPEKPRGLLAPFKKGEYDREVQAYRERQRRDRSLVEQAGKLQKKVLEATHRSENWAVRKLHSLQPEFVDRVERHVQGHNQRLQVAKLEAQQKRQREQGIEGPGRSR